MFHYETDGFVFYNHYDFSKKCIYLVVYVNGIVITHCDQNDIQRLKQHLFDHFQIKNLGKLEYFLEIPVTPSNAGIVIIQREDALDIFKDKWYVNCKHVDTPMKSAY